MLLIRRNFSKVIINPKHSKKKRAETIKERNFETKSLYGPVQKPLKNKSPVIAATVSNSEFTSNSISINEPAMKSEIFWMTKRVPDFTKESKEKKQNKARVKKTAIPISLEKLRYNLVPSPFNISKISTDVKSSIPKILSTITKPFNDNELKMLPQFPLELTDDSRMFVEPGTSGFPSVGKILQATMSENARKALMRWKTLKIAELGETGFSELQQTYLQDGALFHSTVQNHLVYGEKPDNSSKIYDAWKSVEPILDRIDSSLVVEQHLAHPHLKYRGVVDCVATIDNQLHIIEWKKSDRPKPSLNDTYDAPLQMCAYLGAINVDSRFDFNIRKGAVIVAYTSGQPANMYQLQPIELRKYWCAWLYRLQEYWIRVRDGTLPEPI